MNQSERRLYLIRQLLSERQEYVDIVVPENASKQRLLLRALMNVRPPKEIDEDFLHIQDEYLREELEKKIITDVADLKPARDGIYVWKGDITSLRCGAIVNAANSRLLGCFYPNHGCIDNAVHTYAGIQLRLKCARLMEEQGYDEPVGRAKITPAYNLPCDYVIHTVGPIVRGNPTLRDSNLLASCYRSCLELAIKTKIKSVAFCCISTGEFHFPNDQAARIAVTTVLEYRKQINSNIEVVFNVFKDVDYKIYKKLLNQDQPPEGSSGIS